MQIYYSHNLLQNYFDFNSSKIIHTLIKKEVYCLKIALKKSSTF